MPFYIALQEKEEYEEEEDSEEEETSDEEEDEEENSVTSSPLGRHQQMERTDSGLHKRVKQERTTSSSIFTTTSGPQKKVKQEDTEDSLTPKDMVGTYRQVQNFTTL